MSDDRRVSATAIAQRSCVVTKMGQDIHHSIHFQWWQTDSWDENRQKWKQLKIETYIIKDNLLSYIACWYNIPKL